MKQIILDKNSLIKDAQDSFNEFIYLLSSLNSEELNTMPFSGSWTAAQVGAHITKSLNLVAEVKKLPVKKADRHFDDFVLPLKLMFLNFDIKMHAADILNPMLNLITKIF